MSNMNRADKMRNLPIGKLLWSMSLPAVFSMLIQALYNIVDSMYVAQLGQDALFAIGLVFPLQMLSLSIGLGCGVGTNAVVARRLGQKRQDHADQTATTGLLLAVFHAFVIMIFGLLIAKPFLGLFTDDPTIIAAGSSYLYIVMGFGLGQQVQIICERILQATGNMILPMFSLLISAITNILLDPILIFGYFGFPAMGVTGAATATVFSQWLGMIFILYVVIKKDHDVKVSWKNFKLEMVVIQKIYQIGVPTMIMNAIGSITTTCLNGILVAFSDIAVNALSIYFKVQSFAFMPVFGMTQGAMPILAYNYGAQLKKRYTHTIKLMLMVACIILTSGTMVFSFFPQVILNLFAPTTELLAIGSITLRVISYSFIFASVNIVMTTAFQSLGYGMRSMMMSIMRQLMLLIPFAFILAHWIGVEGVWWSYPLSEAIVMIIFIPQAYNCIKKRFG
ncbi:MAG: MATE family efflux transporter [Erysipelotrichaceae bacterium]|nr:MATE family efflux transporter [Erysipelotrichaceae bacterium]